MPSLDQLEGCSLFSSKFYVTLIRLELIKAQTSLLLNGNYCCSFNERQRMYHLTLLAFGFMHSWQVQGKDLN